MKHRSIWAGAVAAAIFGGGCEIGTEALPPVVEEPAAAEASQPRWAPDAPLVEVKPRSPARGRLKFVEGYAQGYALAVSGRKPMLVFFTAPWCRFCHQMAGEAFTHPQVVTLAERFVCILVDADRDPQTCRQFQVTSYPTVQFVSPRGVPLDRIVGKKPAEQLMIAMQTALERTARRDAKAAAENAC
jgi:thiol-disulfide isomerase/thioredoxin